MISWPNSSGAGHRACQHQDCDPNRRQEPGIRNRGIPDHVGHELGEEQPKPKITSKATRGWRTSGNHSSCLPAGRSRAWQCCIVATGQWRPSPPFADLKMASMALDSSVASPSRRGQLVEPIARACSSSARHDTRDNVARRSPARRQGCPAACQDGVQHLAGRPVTACICRAFNERRSRDKGEDVDHQAKAAESYCRHHCGEANPLAQPIGALRPPTGSSLSAATMRATNQPMRGSRPRPGDWA